MSVLYIALPVALLLGAAAVAAFVWSVRRGQYDDLDTPPLRMLFDEPQRSRSSSASTDDGQGPEASER